MRGEEAVAGKGPQPALVWGRAHGTAGSAHGAHRRVSRPTVSLTQAGTVYMFTTTFAGVFLVLFGEQACARLLEPSSRVS